MEQEIEKLKAEIETKIAENSKSAYEQLTALTDAQAVNVRDKERALRGSEECVSFSGSVPVSSTAYFVSKEITSPFAVAEIEAVFDSVPTSGTAPKVYFLVSTDGDSNANGFNLLSDYSQAPYFTGNGQRIKASLNPREFRNSTDSRYIKVYIVNSDGTNAYNLNARVSIKVYPSIPQGTV